MGWCVLFPKPLRLRGETSPRGEGSRICASARRRGRRGRARRRLARARTSPACAFDDTALSKRAYVGSQEKKSYSHFIPQQKVDARVCAIEDSALRRRRQQRAVGEAAREQERRRHGARRAVDPRTARARRLCVDRLRDTHSRTVRRRPSRVRRAASARAQVSSEGPRFEHKRKRLLLLRGRGLADTRRAARPSNDPRLRGREDAARARAM